MKCEKKYDLSLLYLTLCSAKSHGFGKFSVLLVIVVLDRQFFLNLLFSFLINFYGFPLCTTYHMLFFFFSFLFCFISALYVRLLRKFYHYNTVYFFKESIFLNFLSFACFLFSIYRLIQLIIVVSFLAYLWLIKERLDVVFTFII